MEAVAPVGSGPMSRSVYSLVDRVPPGIGATCGTMIEKPRACSRYAVEADITARLNTELNKALQSPEVRERLARLGAEVAVANTPAQFAALVQADSDRWAAIIRERKITLD